MIIILLLVANATGGFLGINPNALAFNPFMFSMLGWHLGILTLTAHKLKHAIKPTVSKNSIQFNTSELEKQSSTMDGGKIKDSVATDNKTKNATGNSVV